MAASRKTILVLEDEGLIAIGIEDLIRDLGFSPIVTGTIDEALRVITATTIDMAVLDYKIRKQDSEPVALELRRRSIPFLVCSGTVSDGLSDAFRDAPFLSKPYSDEQLRAAVLELAGG